MRVLPINSGYSRMAIRKNNNPEGTTKPEVKNMSFGHIGDYVGEVRNYKDCFNRAFSFETEKIYLFRAAFERFTHWVKQVAKVPATEFSSNFEAMLYDTRYGKEVEHINGCTIFARERGTGSVLVMGDPETNTIEFLPPGNKFDPRKLEQDEYIARVQFTKDDDGNFIYTTHRRYPKSDLTEIREMQIWGSTGNLKESFESVGGFVNFHRYYNKDGSENSLKNFFFGT